MRQGVPSLTAFATAMRGQPGFGTRVATFETRFGPVDEATLAVLAQATYLCWGNNEYRHNLMATCRAIGTGRPTTMYYHRQVTLGRWRYLHATADGVLRWLGADEHVTKRPDSVTEAQVSAWLGRPSAIKIALSGVFLCNLYWHLDHVSIGPLAPDALESRSADCQTAHVLPHGERYSLVQHDSLIGAYADAARRAQASPADEVADLIERICQPSPPPCIHRFTRYLDIQLTSIGALAWRKSLPPDTVPRAEWDAFLHDTRQSLLAWARGEPPDGDLAAPLYAVLGAPTPPKQAMVREFLLAETRGDGEPDTCWRWLEDWRLTTTKGCPV